MHYLEFELVGRLFLAAVLGGSIGAERAWRLNRSAGLRTHAMVATASALVVIVSFVTKSAKQKQTVVALFSLRTIMKCC